MLTYPTFSELDATRFAELKDLLVAVIQAYNANIDLRRGAVNDLALHSRSLLAAATEQAVVNALNSGSIDYISANPTLADTDAVDRALGNYRLVRTQAAKAAGSIAIVIESLTPVVIPQGSVFTISGRAFAADASYAARTSSAAVTGINDRLLTATSGGYLFTINVTASLAGEAGNVRRGASATPAQEPFGFVRAYADVDFTGGADEESNAELATRMAAGAAVRAWSNRPSIEAVMRAQPDFAGIKASSVIGMGDPEMTRDQHSIVPISSGSKADLYVRPASSYETVRLRKTATLVSKVGAVGTWQFGLSSSDAPGFYEVEKVLLTTADQSSAGFPIASDVRTTDTSATGWKPDIDNTVESAYTSYQAGTFQFVDTATNATSLVVSSATKDYDVMVRRMPLIGDLQDFWNMRENRPPLGDILVKAAVPCFVSVSMTLNMPSGVTVVAADVQAAVSQAINGLSFTASLAASYISKVVHNLVPDLLTISGMNISGRIRQPNGTAVYLNSSSAIDIPNDPDNLVTEDTVIFVTTEPAISVTVA